MSRIAYVNGRYRLHADAVVHVEDRGYQFADGVYEVIAVQRGRMVDEGPHLSRLDRSLSELRIPWPMSRRALRVVLVEVIGRNRIIDSGLVYLQITRGVAPRSHAIPSATASSLVVTARPLPPFDRDAARKGVAVITIPDIRWKRCDIKTVSLLPNVLGKQQAIDAGAFDAWMIDSDGAVTEGTASNAWIVSAAGELVTRQASSAILNGITRCAVFEIAADQGFRLVERPFTVPEAKSAAEAFQTSTTSLVRPVVRIDDTMIGDGKIGPLTERLLDFYAGHMLAAGEPCGWPGAAS
jgi:D-alanine transaminase